MLWTARATRPPARWCARSASGLRDDHGRPHHGGRPTAARARPGVPRSGSAIDLPHDRASTVRRHGTRLPLLLRPQGHVGATRRLRRLPRRLRNHGRAVRGGHAAQTEKIRYFPIILMDSKFWAADRLAHRPGAGRGTCPPATSPPPLCNETSEVIEILEDIDHGDRRGMIGRVRLRVADLERVRIVLRGHDRAARARRTATPSRFGADTPLVELVGDQAARPRRPAARLSTSRSSSPTGPSSRA